MNFEVNLILLIKLFFSTRLKTKDKNSNILRTKRAFEVKQKAFFIIFKELPVAKNYLRPESAPLNFSASR